MIKTELFLHDKLQNLKGMNIMSNFVIYKGVKISEEQYKRIKNMRQLSDDEIDLSDIPEITKDEWKKFKPARLRRRNLQKAS